MNSSSAEICMDDQLLELIAAILGTQPTRYALAADRSEEQT